MPVDVSPLVVYYNPRLIELDQIAAEGRDEVTAERGWNISEFGLAAAQPRRPGVRGLYIAPRLEQIAPFVWSGGGQVVDDPADPTTLTLADDASRDAFEQLLEVVRDPGLTFGQDAIQRRSALDRFKAGKLGMLLAYRDLTAELRRNPRFTFDVMPLPVVGGGATNARVTGACISPSSSDQQGAADFLAALSSTYAQNTLAATGYVMPANTKSLNAEAFLQEGQRPLHSQVFLRELRDVRMLPATRSWAELETSLASALDDLFYLPVIDPLQERLAAIDASSVPFLDPKAASEIPSPSPSD
jgi:multiple sugar transport system substrate-binding protein